MNGLSAFDDNLALPGLDEQRHTSPPGAYRSGLAGIVSDEGDGSYTITERRWDSDAQQWQDVFAPMGHVSASARDYRDRPSGLVGQLVRFWQQRDLGGEVKLFIDVGELVKVSANDSTPANLADKLVGDDGTGDNITLLI